jgi:hypothetical protein
MRRATAIAGEGVAKRQQHKIDQATNKPTQNSEIISVGSKAAAEEKLKPK